MDQDQKMQMAVNECKPPHPREVLLNDIKAREQRLLDKLNAIHELKHEYMFLSRDEAERIIKLSRLTQRLE